MPMRLRAKFGLAVAGVVGVLALAAAAAPYLLDVEQFKPALVKAVKDATGRELVIEGPMKLSMFPRPQISARHVRFANAAGSIGAQMVDGSLGMGYGVTSSTLLIAIGLAPAAASASVHFAELGTTAVVITHNAAIAGMADRVLHLGGGRIQRIEHNAHKLRPSELSW